GMLLLKAIEIPSVTRGSCRNTWSSFIGPHGITRKRTCCSRPPGLPVIARFGDSNTFVGSGNGSPLHLWKRRPRTSKRPKRPGERPLAGSVGRFPWEATRERPLPRLSGVSTIHLFQNSGNSGAARPAPPREEPCMPHTKSAKKNLRKSEKRRLRNRAIVHTVKTYI